MFPEKQLFSVLFMKTSIIVAVFAETRAGRLFEV